MECLWDQRKKIINTASLNGYRLHPKIMRLCLDLYCKIPHVLDPLRKFVKLPSNRTIRLWKNKVEQSPGWNDTVIRWCLEEAKKIALKEQDYWGGFVLDEMKIQEKLEMVVRNGKHQLVGLVNLGKGHDIIAQLSVLRMALTIDEALERVGGFGFFQKRLTASLGYGICFVLGCQVLMSVFLIAEPAWQCVSNSTICNMSEPLFPGAPNYHARCNMPRSEWEFNREFTSLVTEYDLVCSKTHQGALLASIPAAGSMVGTIVLSILGDKIGRKKICFLGLLVESVVAMLFSIPVAVWYTCIWLLASGFFGATYAVIFVITAEYTDVKNRHVPGIWTWFFWTFGALIVTGLAYGIRDWKVLSVVVGALGIPSILGWWFVPESLRFLRLKGKTEEVEDILRTIAKVNGKKFPAEPIQYDDVGRCDENTGDFRLLFKSREMFKRASITFIALFAALVMFNGINYSSSFIGGSMYFNIFIFTLVEIPGNYCALWVQGRYGRRFSEMLGMIFAAAAAFANVLCTSYDPGHNVGFLAGKIIFAVLAKFIITVAFSNILLHAMELFPTVIRNVGFGFARLGITVGAICAPFVIALARVHILLPYGIMGVLCLAAGTMCLLLVETKGYPMGETMEAIHKNNQSKKDPETETTKV